MQRCWCTYVLTSVCQIADVNNLILTKNTCYKPFSVELVLYNHMQYGVIRAFNYGECAL